MQADFRPPRRRARVLEEFGAPLPVFRIPENRDHYRAELINQHVLVRHPDHIQKLHNQGFFGKGVLSRARPAHRVSDQWEQHEGMLLPVVSAARYEELLRWAESVLASQGLDQEAVRQTVLRLGGAVDPEDLRREAGGLEGAEPKKGAEPKEGPEPMRVCRSDPLSPDHQDQDQDQDRDRDQDQDQDRDRDQDQDRDQDSDSDCDSEPDVQVPGSGFVLVVSESQDGGGVREVRRSPLSLTEYLQLSLEEAFFLVYGLGCLSVYLHEEPLSVLLLWRRFCSLRPDFPCCYAAYHHFRSRGWVPKGGGGAKYGADLMLYRKGPPFYHASYSVVVERTNGSFGGAARRPFSWRSLAALSRVTASVSKELMLCYVIHPEDLSPQDQESPECLSRLQVQEVIVSRWVSSKERAEQDEP